MIFRDGVDFTLRDMCLQKSSWQYFSRLHGQDCAIQRCRNDFNEAGHQENMSFS